MILLDRSEELKSIGYKTFSTWSPHSALSLQIWCTASDRNISAVRLLITNHADLKF